MQLDQEIENAFENLIANIERNGSRVDKPAIRKAVEFAALAHRNQYRLSGEPYIMHCIEVANIVSQYLNDTVSIQASLLHDVCRDAGVPISSIEKEFGEHVSKIVEGLTKLGKIPFLKLEQAEAENIRKMLVVLSKDVRIIIIKLADRLHNMRTISYLPEHKQKRMAEETMEIYVPIAHKLNITKIKNELEDLYLSVMDPDAYSKIKEALAEKRKGKEKETDRIRAEVESLIKSKGIDVIVKSREKHIYSIYRKMKKKELTFDKLMDLFAIRIITKRVSDCYRILEIIGENYKILPETLDDYIASPKSNMYQSIHINFLTENGHNIEAQIRTEEMDRIAEMGIAAHWKYKGHGEEEFDKKIEWMKNLLSWQKQITEEKEYIDGVKIELFERGVVAFTPKGDMIELPNGSTALDFAFALHTSIGLNADKIKVNGKIVPFNHILSDGDIVEVITAPQQRVNINWLGNVKTSKAKAKIRAALNLLGPKKSGAKELETAISEKGKKARMEGGELIAQINSPNINLAKCCNPTINDAIVTYPPKEGRYTIHRLNCKTFEKTPEFKRKINAKWEGHSNVYLQKINLVSEDRPKLLSDLIKVLINHQIEIKKINIGETRDERIIINLVLAYNSNEQIEKIKNEIKKISGIKEVFLVI
ncbi:MAG: RelA/SpoT family protein [Candidatus Micrarchaeota archaeon]|nr:RelA/SpoT family protein [Candidatus Micrarchaeota archaeon]